MFLFNHLHHRRTIDQKRQKPLTYLVVNVFELEKLDCYTCTIARVIAGGFWIKNCRFVRFSKGPVHSIFERFLILGLYGIIPLVRLIWMG